MPFAAAGAPALTITFSVPAPPRLAVALGSKVQCALILAGECGRDGQRCTTTIGADVGAAAVIDGSHGQRGIGAEESEVAAIDGDGTGGLRQRDCRWWPVVLTVPPLTPEYWLAAVARGAPPMTKLVTEVCTTVLPLRAKVPAPGWSVCWSHHQPLGGLAQSGSRCLWGWAHQCRQWWQ